MQLFQRGVTQEVVEVAESPLKYKGDLNKGGHLPLKGTHMLLQQCF